MEDTQIDPKKGKIGIISFILSRKEGQQFLAACLFLIIAQWGIIVGLSNVISKQAKKIDQLHNQNFEIKASDADREIDYWKNKNDNEIKLKNQVDSMKAALEIFKIKQQMK